MNGRGSLRRWAGVLVAVIIAAVVGVVAYNAGVSHGLAISGQVAAAPPPYGPYYGWYRPWGFGFAFPLLFLGFWFLLARSFFWGAPWRRRYYAGMHELPPAFEEWHRQAHERMKAGSDS
jgi:hypothetical protein